MNNAFARRLAGAFAAACTLLLATPAAHADLVYSCTSATVNATYTETSTGRDLVYAYPGGPTVDYPDSAITLQKTSLGKQLVVKDVNTANRKLTLVVSDATLTDNDPHNLSGWYFTTDARKTGILQVDKSTSLKCTVTMPAGPPPNYTLGGNVSAGSPTDGLTLYNNGVDALPIASPGAFLFPSSYPAGSSYAVTASDVVNGTCQVSQGTGTLIGDVSNVVVTCSCKPGWQKCASTSCIDVMVDVSNCGGCGIKCGSNQSCVNGTCTGHAGTKRAFLGQH